MRRTINKLGIGKCLVVVGATIGAHPFTVFFSVPIFILGQLLLWSTPMDRSLKFKWLFVPLLLIVVMWVVIVVISKALGI